MGENIPDVPKVDTSNLETRIKELEAEIAKAKKSDKGGEIRAVSESTMHALLEELKSLRSELKAANSAYATFLDGNKKGWIPF